MGYNQSSMSEFTFPDEIKELMNDITDEKEWKILEFLIQNENELSYTQLRKKLEIPDDKKNLLTYPLKVLQKAGWLRNWLKKGTESTNRQKSYYSITEFGLKVIEGSMKAMEMNSYSTSTWLQLQDTLQSSSTSKLNTTGITNTIATGWSESNAVTGWSESNAVTGWSESNAVTGWSEYNVAPVANVAVTNVQRNEVVSALVNYTNNPLTGWNIITNIINSSKGMLNPLETTTRKKSRLR